MGRRRSGSFVLNEESESTPLNKTRKHPMAEEAILFHVQSMHKSWTPIKHLHAQVKCKYEKWFTCQRILISVHPIQRFKKLCHTAQPGLQLSSSMRSSHLSPPPRSVDRVCRDEGLAQGANNVGLETLVSGEQKSSWQCTMDVPSSANGGVTSQAWPSGKTKSLAASESGTGRGWIESRNS